MGEAAGSSHALSLCHLPVSACVQQPGNSADSVLSGFHGGSSTID